MRDGRIAGLAGMGFIALLLTGIALAPIPPKGSATSAEVSAYFSSYAAETLRQVLVVGLCAGAALLWFVGGLWAHLRNAEQRATTASSVALVGGVAMFPGLVIVAGTHAAAAHVAGKVSADSLWVLWRMSTLADLMTTFLMASFVAGASLSARATRSLPRWTTWVGLACATAYSIMGIDIVLGDSELGQDGVFGMIGLLAFAVWVVATSISLVRVSGRATSDRVQQPLHPSARAPSAA